MGVVDFNRTESRNNTRPKARYNYFFNRRTLREGVEDRKQDRQYDDGIEGVLVGLAKKNSSTIESKNQ
jgi:hypothetical protein